MRRFRAPHLPTPGETTLLDPDTSHHLLTVVQVARGEAVELFDGEGQACPAVVDGVEGERARVRATGPTAPRRAAPLMLAMALPRKPAWEEILRMGTELGVTEFRPFIGRRSVAQGEHLERWTRICVEAAAQCGRGDSPQVAPLAPLPGILARVPGRVLVPGAPVREGPSAALLLGPEGGLTREEVDQAIDAGWEPAGLGPWVLRADTAAAAALSLYGPARH